MAPKDKDNKLQKSGVIYKFKCPHINWPEEYIGESGRTFGERLIEHLRTPSPIHQHSNSTGHPISHECFTIVHRESQAVTGNIKETMYIHVNDPSLSRNLGKYQLPHIWDQVLQDKPALQPKYTQLYLPLFTNHSGGTHIFLVIISMWGCPHFTPTIPYTSLHTINTHNILLLCSPIMVVPSLVSTYNYLGRLTFLLDMMKQPKYGGSKSLS